jgi:hypothetical protein
MRAPDKSTRSPCDERRLGTPWAILTSGRSVATDLANLFERAGSYAVEILKGARPAGGHTGRATSGYATARMGGLATKGRIWHTPVPGEYARKTKPVRGPTLEPSSAGRPRRSHFSTRYRQRSSPILIPSINDFGRLIRYTARRSDFMWRAGTPTSASSTRNTPLPSGR